MKRSPGILLAAVLFAALTACSQAPVATSASAASHDADVQAIKDLETNWNKDIAAKDLNRIVSYYAPDAVLMATGFPPAAGKDAITAMHKQLLDDPNISLKFAASRVEVSGDLAFTQGSYEMTMTDPATKKPANDKGNYVTVYKRQADGSWKAVSDIATSGPPPAPPKSK